MNLATCFRSQAYNNAWANHRLLTACSKLTSAELTATRTSFFPSIIHTLNHILTVDWFYVSALEGHGMGPGAFEPEIPCPGFQQLDHEQRAVDRRLVAVCEDLDESQLNSLVGMPRASRLQQETMGRVLLHLFEHQIHHRGQVHAMLSGTRIKPPQLDEFFMGDEYERSYREGDFAELGFEEAAIWR